MKFIKGFQLRLLFLVMFIAQCLMQGCVSNRYEVKKVQNTMTYNIGPKYFESFRSSSEVVNVANLQGITLPDSHLMWKTNFADNDRVDIAKCLRGQMADLYLAACLMTNIYPKEYAGKLDMFDTKLQVSKYGSSAYPDCKTKTIYISETFLQKLADATIESVFPIKPTVEPYMRDPNAFLWELKNIKTQSVSVLHWVNKVERVAEARYSAQGVTYVEDFDKPDVLGVICDHIDLRMALVLRFLIAHEAYHLWMGNCREDLDEEIAADHFAALCYGYGASRLNPVVLGAPKEKRAALRTVLAAAIATDAYSRFEEFYRGRAAAKLDASHPELNARWTAVMAKLGQMSKTVEGADAEVDLTLISAALKYYKDPYSFNFR